MAEAGGTSLPVLQKYLVLHAPNRAQIPVLWYRYFYLLLLVFSSLKHFFYLRKAASLPMSFRGRECVIVEAGLGKSGGGVEFI